MNRFLILASLLLTAISCSNIYDEQAVVPTQPIQGSVVTLTASLTESGTRVSATSTTDEGWTFAWDDKDAIAAWHNNSCSTPEQFAMATYDGDNSTFTGVAAQSDTHRFIYPYEEVSTTSDYHYPVDISAQDGKLNKTYLINDGLINTQDIVEGKVSTLAMKHVGGFMVVDIYLSGYSSASTYTLMGVEYAGIPVKVELDMSQGVDASELYHSSTKGSVCATNVGEPFVTAIDDSSYLQAITRLNILPFDVATGESLTITLTIDIESAAGVVTTKTASVILTNTDAETLPFARATHNYTYLTVENIDSSAAITGAKINDWDVVESGELTNIGSYTAAEISTSNIPEGNIWIITDETIDTDGFSGIRNALYSIDRDITLIFPNLTAFPSSALYTYGVPLYLISVEAPKATSIGSNAFSYCTRLSTASFPEVTYVGNDAFYDCTDLEDVLIPKATSVVDRVFYNCSSLKSVSFPEARGVGRYTFNGCTTLESVDMPAVDTLVGYYAFRDCIALKRVSHPKVEVVEQNAFEGCCNLTTVDLSAVMSIGDYAFLNCASLESVYLGCVYQAIDNQIITCGSNILSGVSSLPTLYTSIFNKIVTNLTEAGWGTIIYEETIKYDDNLISVTCTAADVSASSIPNGDIWIITDETIDKDSFSNIKAAISSAGKDIYLEFPSLTEFPEEAFYRSSSLPLVSVSAPKVTTVGSSAFKNCDSITSIYLPEAIEIGYYAFFDCDNLLSVSLLKATTIGNGAFSNCTALAGISLPSTKTIGEFVFDYCTSLIIVELPEATSIGDYAFGACIDLVSISLPEVTSIGTYAFTYCSSLKYAYLTTSSLITCGSNVLYSVNTKPTLYINSVNANVTNLTGAAWGSIVYVD